ncbi:MAG: M1 family metallopeptidase [Caldilineales bacterium]|nr:M1 family metallopeptidase [Caldilineales bacterium]
MNRFLPLLLLSLILSACRAASLAPPDPLARYRPAFHAAAVPASVDTAAMPRYDITMRVDMAQRQVEGLARIHFRNLSGRPLNDVYVRLYPNLEQLVGGMRLTRAVTLPEQYAVGYAFILQNTAARITLTQPLPPDADLDLELGYEINAPARQGYVLFGESEGILSLPYSYPILAAQTRDPTNPWRLEIPPAHGDIAIADPAFYAVTVTLPSDVTLISTGVTISVTQPLSDTVDHLIVAGPAREWGLILSRDYQVSRVEVDGTRVNSYYLPADRVAGEAALRYAAGALRVYNRLFAPYPYTELDVVAAPTRYLGMEYPGLNYIGLDTYRGQQESQEWLVAHEVSHQWWYEMVGSDPFRWPWLDEGLAEHSSLLYIANLYGQAQVERIRFLRWRVPTEWAAGHDLDDKVGQEVTAFTAGNYETLVYAKSALFFDALYEAMGREAYLRVLQTLIERYRYRTPTPEDFLALVVEVGGFDPTPLYEQWILSGGE